MKTKIKKQKVSPGPYTVELGLVLDVRRNIVAQMQTRSGLGRESLKMSWIEPEESDANAHLLAASWTMLQVLRKVSKFSFQPKGDENEEDYLRRVSALRGEVQMALSVTKKLKL